MSNNSIEALDNLTAFLSNSLCNDPKPFQFIYIVTKMHPQRASNLVDKFDNNQLQDVTKRVYLVDAVTQIVQRSVLCQQQTSLITHR